MWIVMAGVEITAKNPSRATCFDSNATNLPDEATANAEAERRNRIEKEAGHTNVLWYAMEWPPQMPRR